MISQFKNQYRKFRACSTGAVAAMTAIVLPLLLGFASLGVEVGHWYLGQRTMQGAADAAALSAAAEYICLYNNTCPGGNYQTVGVNYANYNGFTIPAANVCAIPAIPGDVITGPDNCGTVRSLDARAIVCPSPPCVVAEITQDTGNWLTTKMSLEPGTHGGVRGIPHPTLYARSVVSAKPETITIPGTDGGDCVLALAPDAAAVTVHGGSSADLRANCGVAIGNTKGNITFNGSKSAVNIFDITFAGSTGGCPDGGVHCQQFGSTAALTSCPTPGKWCAVVNTPTPDPYAARVAALFAPGAPLGVQAAAIGAAGSGYTNGTCTFTVTGGTYYGAAASPAKFAATISGGKVTGVTLLDPGAYATLPTSPVSVPNTCGGSGATFNLTEGCYNWNGSQSTLIANRKYCTIQVTGSMIFPTGNYWIAGGCFCVSGNGNVTSDVAGVTFFLTNGEGSSASTYATVNMTGTPTLGLCAPGTVCGTKCNDAGGSSCMLFVQNPAAPASTSLDTPGATTDIFNGTQNSTLSGLIYLPNQTYENQGSSKIGGCVGVVAKYFDIGGSPTFSDGCLPGEGIGGTQPTTTTNLIDPRLRE